MKTISEETRQRMREAQRESWKEIKFCVVCGDKFMRREDETRAAFKLRKKCHARCTTDTYAALDVTSYADLKGPEGFGDEESQESTFMSLTWLCQSRHWLRHY